jgi:hypothetical protein
MNKNTTIGRKKANLVIRFGGQEMSLEQVLLSTAQKKAHHMVRDYLMKEFQKKEAAAKILLNGKDIAQVYGFRKCALGAINIIHT